jgi:hypothetical protein
MQKQAAEDMRQLGGRPAHERQWRHVGVDADARKVGLAAGHLHRAVEDGGDVDRMGGPIAPLARQILKLRDDARAICHHAREPVECAARVS